MISYFGRTFYSLTLGLTLVAAATASVAGEKRDRQANRVPLKASTMIIEYNASAEDIGVQFFLDSDGWREVEIFDPKGKEIFSAETEGRLTRQGGGTELFLESVEPSLEDLSLKKFFRRFPEGTYRFIAIDNNGVLQRGNARFTHDIPAGPVILTPAPVTEDECPEVSVPVVIEWDQVYTSIFGEPLEIVRYEVIVENDDLNFDVKLPADTGTLLTVSPELLQPGTEYDFEILAIEESGNQTITEGCFTTD
ncbi:MAG: fibronectin type III domain-containing protein [Acidiferrobacterales bacterium]|nr:fibronectin type III domain-containing protein [Acidiferrobacterales bacterium]